MFYNLCLLNIAYMCTTSQALQFVNPMKKNLHLDSIPSQGARVVHSPDPRHRAAGKRLALPWVLYRSCITEGSSKKARAAHKWEEVWR